MLVFLKRKIKTTTNPDVLYKILMDWKRKARKNEKLENLLIAAFEKYFQIAKPTQEKLRDIVTQTYCNGVALKAIEKIDDQKLLAEVAFGSKHRYAACDR